MIVNELFRPSFGPCPYASFPLVLCLGPVQNFQPWLTEHAEAREGCGTATVGYNLQAKSPTQLGAKQDNTDFSGFLRSGSREVSSRILLRGKRGRLETVTIPAILFPKISASFFHQSSPISCESHPTSNCVCPQRGSLSIPRPIFAQYWPAQQFTQRQPSFFCLYPSPRAQTSPSSVKY